MTDRIEAFLETQFARSVTSAVIIGAFCWAAIFMSIGSADKRATDRFATASKDRADMRGDIKAGFANLQAAFTSVCKAK